MTKKISSTKPCGRNSKIQTGAFLKCFSIVKLGCTGVYIFLIFALKHRLWVLTEAVLTCTHDLCFEQKYENSKKIK